MRKTFKCDCSTHILEIVYDKATKDLDFENLGLAIYDVYNPKTGRKYRKPKLVADVVLADGQYPKELTDFFDFMIKVTKNRKEHKTLKSSIASDSQFYKNINNAIKSLDEMYKKQKEKYKNEKSKRNK